MEDQPQRSETRRMFRWLAGLSCPFFLFAAFATAFPQALGGEGPPSVSLAVLLFWGGILFAGIAGSGTLRRE